MRFGPMKTVRFFFGRIGFARVENSFQLEEGRLFFRPAVPRHHRMENEKFKAMAVS